MEFDKAEFLDDFIEDMSELMAQSEIALHKLVNDYSDDIINELFRVAHSIKGMSASMEFKKMETLTHKMEDLMFVVRDKTLSFSKEILEVLEIGFAFLNELFTSIKLSGVEDDAPCEGMEVLLDRIKEFLKDINKDKETTIPSSPKQEKVKEIKINSKDKIAKISIEIDNDSSFKTVRAFMVLNRLKTYGNIIKTIPDENLINGKDYVMKANIFSIFIELESEEFDNIKKDITNIMEIDKVKIEYVKDILVDVEINYNDNRDSIRSIIELIELKIVKMELNGDSIATLYELHDEFITLKKLVKDCEFPEVLELVEELIELVEIYKDINVSKDFILIEDVLESLLSVKDILSFEKMEEISELDLKNINRNKDKIRNIILQETATEKQQLGNILLNTGAISASDVDDILRIQKEKYPDKKFGEIALSENKVKSSEIISALKIQNKKVDEKKDDGIELLKVPVTKADHLIDLLEELMMVQSQLEKNILNDFNRDSHTVKTMLTSFRITKEIQNLSISFRMITLRNIFQKLNITVRDSLKKLDKKANVIFYGEDTVIDRVVGNKIIDPLLHLVKNSVSHGIEPPEERVSKGKRETGIISVSARAEKGYVYIEITDDGQGINPEKVIETAIKKGIISESSKLTENEILNLIFAPGFSTAEKVDTISGRGVGTDVAKTEIEKLGGRITISNKVGQGVTFSLKLPQNMTSLNGTVVEIMDGKYIVPTVYIKEIFSINEETHISVVGKKQYAKLRNKIIPIIPAENYFSGEDNSKIMIVLEVDGEQKALPVKQVLERREIVVKPLSDDFDNIKYITGASILGDGKAALIISVEQLFKDK